MKTFTRNIAKQNTQLLRTTIGDLKPYSITGEFISRAQLKRSPYIQKFEKFLTLAAKTLAMQYE